MVVVLPHSSEVMAAPFYPDEPSTPILSEPDSFSPSPSNFSPLINPVTYPTVLATFKASEFYNNTFNAGGVLRRRRASSDPTLSRLPHSVHSRSYSESASYQIPRPSTSSVAEEKVSELRKCSWLSSALHDESISFIPPPQLSNLLPQEAKAPKLIRASAKRTSRSSLESSESSLHLDDYTFDIHAATNTHRDRTKFFDDSKFDKESPKLTPIALGIEDGPQDFTADIANYMKGRSRDETERLEKRLASAAQLVRFGQDDLGRRTLQLQAAERQLEVAAKDLNEARNELKLVRDELDRNRIEMERSKDGAHENMQDLRRTQSELSTSKQDLGEAQSIIRELKFELKNIKEDFFEVQANFQIKARSASEMEILLRETQAELNVTRDEFKETKDELEQIKEDLEETELELERVRSEVKETDGIRASIDTELSQSRKDLYACQQKLEQCQQDFAKSKEDLDEARRYNKTIEDSTEVILHNLEVAEAAEFQMKQELKRATGEKVEFSESEDLIDLPDDAEELRACKEEWQAAKADLHIIKAQLRREKHHSAKLLKSLQKEEELRDGVILDLETALKELEMTGQERERLTKERDAFKWAMKMAKKKYDEMETKYKERNSSYKKEVLRMMYERNEARASLFRASLNKEIDYLEQIQLRQDEGLRPSSTTSSQSVSPERSSSSSNTSVQTSDFTVLTVSTFN